MQRLSNKLKGQPLISLLALSLATSILLNSGNFGYGQTATSTSGEPATPREELIVDIKAYAERHVEAGAPLQTSIVLEAFRENEAGLTSAEIIETYEIEYSRLKKEQREKESGWWNQIKPQAGWLVAGLIAVLALAWKTIGKWLTQAMEKAGEAVYNQVAGNRLFRGLALQRYRKALFKKHKELHIPFRAGRPLDMEDVYIPLQVEREGTTEQIDAYGAITRYKRLVVTGPPGGGKSMLLKHIALAYSLNKLDLPDRPIPIIIELHRLTKKDLTTADLIQLIVEAFKRDGFPRAEKFVQQSLKGSLMLLLDGLDEVSSDVRPRAVQVIKDLIDTHENCRVIVTCRTAVYREEFVSVAQQTLKVSEFSDQQIRRFLRSWEREMPQDKSIEQLLQTLRDRPRIVELARNPLLLTIIAHLYSNPSFVLPYSRTEFYQTSTNILLEQWDQFRQSFNLHKALNKRRVLQHLALVSQTNAHRDQQDRRRMDHYVVLEEIKGILPDLNLEPKDAESILKEIVERSGLLLVVDGGEGYKFSHLTLQEYFAAEALKDNSNELVLQFRQSPDEWREVVKLWCGFSGNSTEFIQAVYEIDAITGFECLADAQEIAPKLANRIIGRFKSQLGNSSQQQAQITSAFGAVAADIRPRGTAVFHYLESVLNDLSETHRHKSIAEALSKTNLLKAATVLSTHYSPSPVIRLPLVRMGDLAVDSLQDLAQSHTYSKATVLEDLFTIGTPSAAISLLHILRADGSSPIQKTQSAWYLTSLLPRPGIEAAIKSEAERLSQTIRWPMDWIWQPFGEPPEAPLAVTIGQIAYSLTQGPDEAVPALLPALDPRIVVPLCTIHLRDAVQLPKRWPPKAETLLEQKIQTDEIESQIQDMVAALLPESAPNSRWQALLSGLSPKLQLDIIQRLILSRSPNKNHWRDIFHTVEYEFRTGWQYRCVLLVTAIASILSFIEMGFIISRNSNRLTALTMGLSLNIILAFWMVLRKGLKKNFGPETFLQLGPLGIVAYNVELKRFYQSQLVWPEISLLFTSLCNTATGAGSISGSIAFAGAVSIIFVGAVSGILTSAGAFTFTFASIVAFAGIFAGAVGVGIGNGGTFSLVVVSAVAIVFFGADAFAFAGTFAGAGLGAWHRPLSTTEGKSWLNCLAFLALPWFCSFPLILLFTVSFLHDIAALTWMGSILVNIFIITFCTILWWGGKQKELKALNPLQGGFLQQELEAMKRYHPIDFK